MPPRSSTLVRTSGTGPQGARGVDRRGTEDRAWVFGVRLIGITLFVLSAVLTITSGVAYFRRHGRVLMG